MKVDKHMHLDVDMETDMEMDMDTDMAFKDLDVEYRISLKV